VPAFRRSIVHTSRPCLHCRENSILICEVISLLDGVDWRDFVTVVMNLSTPEASFIVGPLVKLLAYPFSVQSVLFLAVGLAQAV
jgi:hypothetical protein